MTPQHSLTPGNLSHAILCWTTAPLAYVLKADVLNDRDVEIWNEVDYTGSLLTSPCPLPLGRCQAKAWKTEQLTHFASCRATELRWTTLPWSSLCLPCWGTGRMSSLETCPRYTTSTTSMVLALLPLFASLISYNDEAPKKYLAHSCVLSPPLSLAEYSCTVWKAAWEHPREWDFVS